MNQAKLLHVAHALFCEPWLIRPEMHGIMCDVFAAHASGGEVEIQRRALGNALSAGRKRLPFRAGPGDDDPNGQRPPFAMVNNVAVLPLHGVIGRRVGALEKSSGVTDTDDFINLLRTITDDNNVAAVVLHIDSPGGTVAGVVEAAAEVLRCKACKPIVAFTDSMMASAAYWIGCPADAIHCGEMASVGSVGVYLSLLDQSEAYKRAGYSVELFKSGKFKGMGEPGTTLTDDQRTALQAHVDEIGATFRAHVKATRFVADEHLDGRDFLGATAKKLGFVDEVSTLEEAIAEAGRLARNHRR